MKSKASPEAESRVWVCEYGIRHGIHDPCGCEKRYAVGRYEFRKRTQELFSKDGKPVFPRDVTDGMRRSVLESFRSFENLESRNLA